MDISCEDVKEENDGSTDFRTEPEDDVHITSLDHEFLSSEVQNATNESTEFSNVAHLNPPPVCKVIEMTLNPGKPSEGLLLIPGDKCNSSYFMISLLLHVTNETVNTFCRNTQRYNAVQQLERELYEINSIQTEVDCMLAVLVNASKSITKKLSQAKYPSFFIEENEMSPDLDSKSDFSDEDPADDDSDTTTDVKAQNISMVTAVDTSAAVSAASNSETPIPVMTITDPRTKIVEIVTATKSLLSPPVEAIGTLNTTAPTKTSKSTTAMRKSPVATSDTAMFTSYMTDTEGSAVNTNAMETMTAQNCTVGARSAVPPAATSRETIWATAIVNMTGPEGSKRRPRESKKHIHYCTMCGKSARNRITIETCVLKHLVTFPSPFSRLLTKEDIAYHATHCRIKQSFSCRLCPKKFTNLQNRKLHMNKHLGLKPFTCQECQEKFCSKSALDNHSSRIHRDVKSYKCKVCGERFIHGRKRDTHYFTHSREELEKHPGLLDGISTTCETCGKIMRATSLKRHKKRCSAVPSESQSFVCDICGSQTLTAIGLKRHKRRHGASETDGESQNSAMCHICGQICLNAGGLIKHLTTHTDDTTHVTTDSSTLLSSVSSKGFLTHGQLDLHAQPTHKANRRCICPLCGKSFQSPAKLFYHEKNEVNCKKKNDKYGRNYRGDSPCEINLRKQQNKQKRHRRYLSCKECDRTFSSAFNLRRHISGVHLGSKKFACDLCNRRFTQKHSLDTHRISHTGEKRFGCKVCGKRFRYRSTLYTHNKNQVCGKS